MRKLTSAQVAKQRLQYAIAIDRAANDGPEYKPGNHRIFDRDITVRSGDVVLLWYEPKIGHGEVTVHSAIGPSMLDIDRW